MIVRLRWYSPLCILLVQLTPDTSELQRHKLPTLVVCRVRVLWESARLQEAVKHLILRQGARCNQRHAVAGVSLPWVWQSHQVHLTQGAGTLLFRHCHRLYGGLSRRGCFPAQASRWPPYHWLHSAKALATRLRATKLQLASVFSLRRLAHAPHTTACGMCTRCKMYACENQPPRCEHVNTVNVQ